MIFPPTPTTTYLAWCPVLGYEEADACEVQARASESAAEQWAEESDCDGDYTIISQPGKSYTVHVRDPDGDETRWAVTGETVPEYTAEALS